MADLENYINTISDVNQLQGYLDSIRNNGNFGNFASDYSNWIYKNPNNSNFYKFMINNFGTGVEGNPYYSSGQTMNKWGKFVDNPAVVASRTTAIQNRIAALVKNKASENAAVQKAAQANALTSASEAQNLATARTNLLNNSLKNYQANLNKRAMNTRYTTA